MTYTPGIDRSRVDILTELLADHRAVEDMFDRWHRTAVDDRAEYFCELVPMLVGHEVAEEMVVFPALRGRDELVGPVVDVRLAEQAAAEQVLSAMEGMDPRSQEFAEAFGHLRVAVLQHAGREEVEVFPLFDRYQDTLDRPTLAIRYTKAKEAAPTHPHPHAPDTPPGNTVLGPITGIVDRVRDALH